MIFGDLLTSVYRTLLDPGQAAWPNSAVALHATEALRRVTNCIGLESGRSTLAMVEGQQEYVLPRNVKQLTAVSILPENGANPSSPIQQYDMNSIPYVVEQNAEPRGYALLAGRGEAKDQLALFMYPAPARSAAGAIILDYKIDFELTSADPASVNDKAQFIPIPPMFNLPVVWLTCAGLLMERDDTQDVQKGQFFESKAVEVLVSNVAMNSVSSYNIGRAFP